MLHMQNRFADGHTYAGNYYAPTPKRPTHATKNGSSTTQARPA
jgi:hypothetical protein